MLWHLYVGIGDNLNLRGNPPMSARQWVSVQRSVRPLSFSPASRKPAL